MLIRLTGLLICLGASLSLLTPDRLSPANFEARTSSPQSEPSNPQPNFGFDPKLPPEVIALSAMPSFPPEPKIQEAHPQQPPTWAVFNPAGGPPILQQAPLYPAFAPTQPNQGRNSPPNVPAETVSSPSDMTRVQQNFRIQQKGNRNDYNNVNARQMVKTAAINRSFIAQNDNKNLANNVLLDQRQKDGKNEGWVVQKNNNNIANFANIRQIREGEGVNVARVVQDKNPHAYNFAKTQQGFRNTTYGNLAVTTKMDGLKKQIFQVKTQYVELKNRKDLRDQVAKILGIAAPPETNNASQQPPQNVPADAQPAPETAPLEIELQKSIFNDNTEILPASEYGCSVVQNEAEAPPLEDVQEVSQARLENQGFEFYPNQKQQAFENVENLQANTRAPLADVIEPPTSQPDTSFPKAIINVGAQIGRR